MLWAYLFNVLMNRDIQHTVVISRRLINLLFSTDIFKFLWHHGLCIAFERIISLMRYGVFSSVALPITIDEQPKLNRCCYFSMPTMIPQDFPFLGCVHATHIFVWNWGSKMAAFPVMVPDFFVL